MHYVTESIMSLGLRTMTGAPIPTASPIPNTKAYAFPSTHSQARVTTPLGTALLSLMGNRYNPQTEKDTFKPTKQIKFAFGKMNRLTV